MQGQAMGSEIRICPSSVGAQTAFTSVLQDLPSAEFAGDPGVLLSLCTPPSCIFDI